MRIAAICLVSALALTAVALTAVACSKKPAATTESSSAAPAAPDSSAPKARLSALIAPHRKPGLWQMAIDTSGGPGVQMKMQVCMDAKTDQDWQGAHSPGAKNCQQTLSNVSLNGVTIDSVCKSGARTITTHGVVTGDFDKSYKMDMTTHFEPATAGMSDVKSSIKADWMGPCPPDLKPGRVKMGGMVIGR